MYNYYYAHVGKGAYVFEHCGVIAGPAPVSPNWCGYVTACSTPFIVRMLRFMYFELWNYRLHQRTCICTCALLFILARSLELEAPLAS